MTNNLDHQPVHVAVPIRDKWTTEWHPAKHMPNLHLSVSADELLPCAVAPTDDPTANCAAIPFETDFLPDGRRAIPFPFLAEAELLTLCLNDGTVQ